MSIALGSLLATVAYLAIGAAYAAYIWRAAEQDASDDIDEVSRDTGAPAWLVARVTLFVMVVAWPWPMSHQLRSVAADVWHRLRRNR